MMSEIMNKENLIEDTKLEEAAGGVEDAKLDETAGGVAKKYRSAGSRIKIISDDGTKVIIYQDGSRMIQYPDGTVAFESKQY